VGGYSDWLQHRSAAPARLGCDKRAREAVDRATPAEPRPRTRLGYKEQRELTSLPGEIEALEQEQAAINARMSAPDYYQQGAQGAPQIRADRKRMEEIEALLLAKFERWEALEAERSRLSR
jgi:ATP-binding cassette subfamily F protein uup